MRICLSRIIEDISLEDTIVFDCTGMSDQEIRNELAEYWMSDPEEHDEISCEMLDSIIEHYTVEIPRKEEV